MFEDMFNYIRIYESEEEAKEDFFYQRTKIHISLVQHAAKRIAEAYPEFGELVSIAAKHDASKFEEPEKSPYIEITWKKRPGNDKKEGPTEEENQATIHHIKNNPHHPEYWLEDQSKANLSSTNRDDSVSCVDATRMPDIAVAEMVADWQAMSDELGTNTARQWFDKVKDVRWHFSPHQEELIDKLLKVFEQ